MSPHLSRAALAAAAMLPALLFAAAPPWSEVAARAELDAAAGQPLVAHVIVPLCDNEHQGIVPVPVQLGDGGDPDRNLFWGAAFGVRTFFTRQAGWTLVRLEENPAEGVLERILLRRVIQRNGAPVTCFVVAEAWDGARMPEAMERFLSLAAGGAPQFVALPAGDPLGGFNAGGASHFVAFVGHDGFMDFSLAAWPDAALEAEPRACAVFACASQTFFALPLERAGPHRTVLTTGLMAAEAYTLAAVLEGFFAGDGPDALRERAAAAYDRYQKCGLRAARRLFTGDP